LTWPPDPITSFAGDAAAPNFHIIRDSTFFPPGAFYSLTAMSDRALAYSNEPLKHRHLVIYEAAGMASDFATHPFHAF
jgi:hypothetical protein